MSVDRIRGFRLAEEAMGGSAACVACPAFPRVGPARTEAPLPAEAGLSRELGLLARLPAGRAEAERAFLAERGWSCA